MTKKGEFYLEGDDIDNIYGNIYNRECIKIGEKKEKNSSKRSKKREIKNKK